MPERINKLKSQQGNILLISMAMVLLAMAAGSVVSYYVVSAHGETNIGKYYTLMESIDTKVEAIRKKAARLDPLQDVGKLRRKKTLNDLPELKILVDRDSKLRLEGIVFQQGRPVALVNDRILQLHEEIGGYRIIHIGDSSVLFIDKEGETREISIYEELKKYETR